MTTEHPVNVLYGFEYTVARMEWPPWPHGASLQTAAADLTDLRPADKTSSRVAGY